MLCMPFLANAQGVTGAADTGSAAIHIRTAESIDSDSPTPPPTQARWLARALPDRWLDSARSDAGSVWYRLTLPKLPPSHEGNASLWVPKLSMNAELWIDGKRLVGTDDGARDTTPRAVATRFWNSPWLTPIPKHANDPDLPLVLHVRVKATATNDGGLSALWFGDSATLRTKHEALSFVRVTLPSWCIAFGLSLGLLFIFVWMHNHAYHSWGYFGAAALVWSLSSLNLTVNHIPITDAWWETCVQLFNFMGLWLLIVFGFSFAGALTPRLSRWLNVHAAATCALLFTTTHHISSWKSPLVMAPLLVLGIWALTTIARWVRRNALSTSLLFPTVATVTFMAAAHDWAIQAGLITVEQPFFLPLASPLLLGTIAWLLAADYARAQHGLLQLNRDLDARVRAREKELHASFERQGRVESALAVAEERTRILRDMHDGAGAHLSTAIRLVEHGTAKPADVAQTLRDALDQLKLSIDALNIPPGDVVALLANLRFRLEPRLADAGIALVWAMEDLPLWPGGHQERGMQNLQFIVFEIVSNVLQHARASQFRIEANLSKNQDAIRLIFADNGQGHVWQSDSMEPRIATIRKRVLVIGAKLEVANAKPGLLLAIDLPMAN